MRLEYRLLDEVNDYPVLYYYDTIAEEEIALRFACDYFIKDNITYEKTSTASEPDVYVIYVKQTDDSPASVNNSNFSATSGIWVELREYRDKITDYPLVHTFKFAEYMAGLLHLQSDFLYFMGQEWQKTSAELDEDRRVYVVYAQPVRR